MCSGSIREMVSGRSPAPKIPAARATRGSSSDRSLQVSTAPPTTSSATDTLETASHCRGTPRSSAAAGSDPARHEKIANEPTDALRANDDEMEGEHGESREEARSETNARPPRGEGQDRQRREHDRRREIEPDQDGATGGDTGRHNRVPVRRDGASWPSPRAARDRRGRMRALRMWRRPRRSPPP